MCQKRRPCCTSCFVQWAEFVNQNTNSFFRAVSLSFLLQFTAIQNGTWPTDYRRTNCFNAWFVMWCVYLVPMTSLHYLHFKFFFPICFFSFWFITLFLFLLFPSLSAIWFLKHFVFLLHVYFFPFLFLLLVSGWALAFLLFCYVFIFGLFLHFIAHSSYFSSHLPPMFYLTYYHMFILFSL